ncbi:enoyl-[acyl-carrier-protein] reductase FabV, partial [Pseudoalteromonas sp. S3178]
QINGLFRESLYGDTPRFDEGGHLFQNYKELEEDVQSRIQVIWDSVNSETIDELTDYVGYHNEFLRLFGFGIESIDYDQEVDSAVV